MAVLGMSADMALRGAAIAGRVVLGVILLSCNTNWVLLQQAQFSLVGVRSLL
jgi:hypothetical protein